MLLSLLILIGWCLICAAALGKEGGGVALAFAFVLAFVAIMAASPILFGPAPQWGHDKGGEWIVLVPLFAFLAFVLWKFCRAMRRAIPIMIGDLRWLFGLAWLRPRRSLGKDCLTNAAKER